ncbi:hypothetical protein ORV05_26610 [Amycolatopsis cynarae]|uniref:NYN domain-containing protein n=1 Tax=Amycolatopsis cynarae TaxID=2995223 RepID=A0ABY7AXQ6_9PSEU|nr:hypothetical protein [Amycolatopsis sp. HUAS 11-8]WAL64512.1 hypothetical protein ORV05_26610 [Amycolatopsis sp. HUAS 11-8]
MSMSVGKAGAADSARLLDREIRQKLAAVVVDANAYGPVGPDIGRLTSLAADLAKLGIETWIPEPVAWEWAEHLSAEWATTRNVARKALGRLTRSGLSAMSITPGYKDASAVVDAFLSTLTGSPHIEIITLTGESAIQGLKDQILQRPPAKRKSAEAVKTGGSDSAWLRDVLAQANAPETLLFLTEDNDIKRAFQEWGHGQPLTRTAATIRASLFEDVPASVVDQWLVARYLSARLPMDLDGNASTSEGQLVGSTPNLLQALDIDWEEHGWTGGSLTRLTGLAGLFDVMCEAPEVHDPGRSPDTRTIRATAVLLADAETIHVFPLGGEDPVNETTASHIGLTARTTLVLQVRGEEIISVRPDSETIVFPESRYEDNWDAMEGVEDALTSIPGLALPEGWGGWQTKGDRELIVDGINVVVNLSWDHGDHGGFVLKIGDEEARISCQHDDGAWVGGSDGIYVEPPYYVTVETPEMEGGDEWALSSWMIRCLSKEG